MEFGEKNIFTKISFRPWTWTTWLCCGASSVDCLISPELLRKFLGLWIHFDKLLPNSIQLDILMQVVMELINLMQSGYVLTHSLAKSLITVFEKFQIASNLSSGASNRWMTCNLFIDVQVWRADLVAINLSNIVSIKLKTFVNFKYFFIFGSLAKKIINSSFSPALRFWD